MTAREHTTPSTDVPVVIVGAGPTGMTAAALLARHGVASLVLDRWTDVYPQPRAVHLDDEVHRILHAVGVAEEFSAISRPMRGLRLVDRDLRLLAQFDRDDEVGSNGYPAANMFDQPELEALLRRHAVTHPLVTFRGGVDVTQVEQPAPGAAVVRLTDIATGEESVVHAAFVLGCDGANSLVRERIGAHMRDLRFEQRWLVVDVETDADLGQWDGAHQVCDHVRAGTYMRVGETRYRWEFQLLDGESAEDHRAVEDLLPLISPWTGSTPAEELTLVRVAEYTFRAQVADRWRDRNVFLLGDAAHLTPPFIGQGMGAGVRDAANLAWKLAGVIDRRLPAWVLDTYEQERAPHVTRLIRLARDMGTVMTRGGRLGTALRRAVLPTLGTVPAGLFDLLDSETDPLTPGPLVRPTGRADRLAGRLAPNPVVAPGRRLDDVAGAGFALLTLDEPAPSDRAVLIRRDVHVHVVAGSSPLAAWLREGRVRAALVRPDRTVLAASRAVSELVGLAVGLLAPAAADATTDPVPGPAYGAATADAVRAATATVTSAGGVDP